MHTFFTAAVMKAFHNELPAFHSSLPVLQILPHQQAHTRHALSSILTPVQAELLMKESDYIDSDRIDFQTLHSEKWQYLDDFALSLAQVAEVPYLLLYVLTANELGRVGDREHLQVLLGLIISHVSTRGISEANAVIDFFKLVVKVDTHPRRLFHSNVFLQSCLALTTSLMPVKWRGRTPMTLSHRFATNMEQSFPLKQMQTAVHGNGDEMHIIASYLLVYLRDHYITVYRLDDTEFYLKPIFDKLGLTQVLKDRLVIDAFLTEANEMLSMKGADENRKRKLDDAFDKCERALKKARKEDAV